MQKIIRANSTPSAFLHQIGNVKWASRRTLDLFPVCDRWIIRSIKRLQDQGLVSCKPMTHGRRFRLREKGYAWLLESNPDRFRDRARSMVLDGEFHDETIRRISLVGEACAMAELAGYSVHPDDKPDIRELSARLHTTAGTDGNENNIHNVTSYHYYSEADRKSFGTPQLDVRQYQYRSTPIGCYYPIRELRQLADMEVLDSGGTIFDLDAVLKFSKISGLLFAHDGGYRVFSTEHTAMRLRPSGEAAMQSYLEQWSANVYKRSLESVYGKSYNGVTLRGSILFGDKSHRAAISVIRETWRREYRQNRGQNARIAAGRNFNLIDIKEVVFVPVLRDALPLLEFMLLPNWESELRRVAMSFLTLAGSNTVQEYPAAGDYDGKLEDGRDVACMLSMDLRRIMRVFSDLNSESPGVLILGMEWQSPFYMQLSDLLEAEKVDKIDVSYVPTSFLLRCINIRYRNLGYSGNFQGNLD